MLGGNIWLKPGYMGQVGSHPVFYPYFTGWTEVLTARLAAAVTDDPKNLQYQIGGTSSEDVSLGVWAARAAAQFGENLDVISIERISQSAKK